ncbi:MAG: hypothetical protein ABI777_12935 [Betaproteobacteria bacterium]
MDVTNASGFNLGSNAKLIFGSPAAGSAILNIDASGNASQIFGSLESTALSWGGCAICTVAPAMFVANSSTGIGYVDVMGGQSTAKVNRLFNVNMASLPGLPAGLQLVESQHRNMQ